MITRVTDINTDPSCGKATDPETALYSIPSPEDIMTLGGSAGHSDLYGPGGGERGGSVTLKHQHGLRCQPRLWVSAQPSMATGATDINMESRFSRAMDPDIV